MPGSGLGGEEFRSRDVEPLENPDVLVGDVVSGGVG